MKMNTNIAIKTGFLLSLIFLATVLFFSYSFFAHYTKQDKEENYVFSVIVTLDELLKFLRNERTAQRDFISSNDNRYLKEYENAVQSVQQQLTLLQDATHRNERYREKLAEIVPLIQKRQLTLEEGIKTGMSASARGRLGEIIEVVSAIKLQTIRDIQESSANQQHSLKIVWYMLIINGAIVLILISAIFLLLRRDISRRTLDGLELRRHRDQLDLLVAQRTEELLTANQLLQGEMHVRKQTEYSLHKLNEHMENIREEERVAISRDIHDEIGQSLTAVKLDLAWMEHRFLPGNSEFIGRLNMMHLALNRLIGKAQGIIANLRPPLLDNLGLTDAIDWQIREFRNRNEIACHLHMDKAIKEPDKKVATAVIRIAIEALTNISRHAQATMVNVSLTCRNNSLILEISDNGCGISSEACNSPTAYGLLGMQERARLCQGELVFNGIPGSGTTVCLSIPIEPMQEQL